MTVIQQQTLERAVLNVAKWGDTDIFPFPVENHIMHDVAPAVVAHLQEVEKGFYSLLGHKPYLSYSTLAPVGYTGFRWATQIDPSWNAYLLALVLELAPSIEGARIPEEAKQVFSYRYRSGATDSVFSQDSWLLFQRQTRELAETHQYVVSVDIADFYSRIYHHRLQNALTPIDADGHCTRQIMRILQALSDGSSYGLPVGGPAARLLAELVLNRVDHLLRNEQSTRTFCRYADDYRFFVDDIQSAYQAIGFLSEKLLRNDGLSVQKSKTRIMTSAEYLSMLDPVEPPPGSAAKFLGLHIHYDPYSATADDDYELLKSQIDEFDVQLLLREELNKGRVHTALTRRLIAALRFMQPFPRQQAAISLLENLETLAPVIPQVMLAVRSAIDDLDDAVFTADVHRRIREIIQGSHYLARIDLNLSYMVRVLGAKHSIANEQLLAQLFNAPHSFTGLQSTLIQRDIVLIFANWRLHYWLSDLKGSFTGLNAWVKRAFLIGSYNLGDEGEYWRKSVQKSLGGFDEIVRDWADAKNTATPSWQVPV